MAEEGGVAPRSRQHFVKAEGYLELCDEPDRLPQPYHMLDKILTRIIEAALDEVDLRAKQRELTRPLNLDSVNTVKPASTCPLESPTPCYSINGSELYIGRKDGCVERYSMVYQDLTLESNPILEGEPITHISSHGLHVAVASTRGVAVVIFPPPPVRLARSISLTSSRKGSIASLKDIEEAERKEASEKDRMVVLGRLGPDKIAVAGEEGCQVTGLALSPCCTYLAVISSLTQKRRCKVVVYKIASYEEQKDPAPMEVVVEKLSPDSAPTVSPRLFFIPKDTQGTVHALLVVWVGCPAATLLTIHGGPPGEVVKRVAEAAAALKAAVEPPPQALPVQRKPSKGKAAPPPSERISSRPSIPPPPEVLPGVRELDLPRRISAVAVSELHELLALGCMDGLLHVLTLRDLSLTFTTALDRTKLGRDISERPLMCLGVVVWRKQYVAATWGKLADDSHKATLTIHDLATEELVYSFKNLPPVHSLATFPHSPLLYFAAEGCEAVTVFDMKRGKVVSNLTLDPMSTVLGAGPDKGLPFAHHPRDFSAVLITLAACCFPQPEEPTLMMSTTSVKAPPPSAPAALNPREVKEARRPSAKYMEQVFAGHVQTAEMARHAFTGSIDEVVVAVVEGPCTTGGVRFAVRSYPVLEIVVASYPALGEALDSYGSLDQCLQLLTTLSQEELDDPKHIAQLLGHDTATAGFASLGFGSKRDLKSMQSMRSMRSVRSVRSGATSMRKPAGEGPTSPTGTTSKKEVGFTQASTRLSGEDAKEGTVPSPDATAMCQSFLYKQRLESTSRAARVAKYIEAGVFTRP